MPQRKILAIPYILLRKSGKKTRFLVVRNAEFQEWSFISGTCEPRESIDKCAVREIHEETRGLISLKGIPKRTRRFQTTYQGDRVDVLFIPLQLTEEEMGRMVEDFPVMNTYDMPGMEENTEIRFETLGQFKRRRRVWSFIQELYDTEDFMLLCPK